MDMKIYKTQKEIEADIVDGVLTIHENVTFECSFTVNASIEGQAWNIHASNIEALNIHASNIEALNIEARDINAWNINARDINARDINASNINARDINARDISFYAVCFAFFSLICRSIVGRRVNSKYFCLDSKVVIDPKII